MRVLIWEKGLVHGATTKGSMLGCRLWSGGGGNRAEMGASGWQSISACRGKDAWPMGEGMDGAGSWDERLLGCWWQQVHR